MSWLGIHVYVWYGTSMRWKNTNLVCIWASIWANTDRLAADI